MFILNWLKTINFIGIIMRLYPIVKEAVIETARESQDTDEGWTDKEKKAFAVSLIYRGIEATGLPVSDELRSFIPDMVEFVWHFVVKRELKVS